jgi:hypothetical protein
MRPNVAEVAMKDWHESEAIWTQRLPVRSPRSLLYRDIPLPHPSTTETADLLALYAPNASKLVSHSSIGRKVRTEPNWDLPQSPPSHDEIVTRVASLPEEMLAAFRLTYHSYQRAGLAPENAEQLRVTPYQLHAESEILLALKEDEVIATLSIIADGPGGLPMEEVFAEEVAEIRRAGKRIVEVSCLADRREKVERSVSVLLRLIKLLIQTTRQRGIDKLLIAVHPRHVAFYERMIGFVKIGDERNYGAVLDRPAVAMSLDLKLPNENSPRPYRQFFVDPLPYEQTVRSVPRCEAFLARMNTIAERHLADIRLAGRRASSSHQVDTGARQLPAWLGKASALWNQLTGICRSLGLARFSKVNRSSKASTIPAEEHQPNSRNSPQGVFEFAEIG